MCRNIEVSHSLSENQVNDLMSLYKEASWCKDRQINDVKKMLEKSWIIALTDYEEGKLIAFARVLTDFTYRAFIYDVIIEKNYRKLGYGRFLLDSIVNHEDIRDVERIELMCIEDKVPFYNKLGFHKVPNDTSLMRYEKPCGV